MAKINLRKQNFGVSSFDVVEDVEGVLYNIPVGSALTTNHINYLDDQKAIDGFLVHNKKGFVDAYIVIVDAENFQIIRNVDVEVTILIF